MSNRSCHAIVFAALAVTTSIACAPPTPLDEGADSFSALRDRSKTPDAGGGGPASNAGNGPAEPTRFNRFGTSRFNPRLAGVEERVRIKNPGDAARVCYAFLDGTETQRRACDSYPSNYEEMTCADKPTTTIAESFGGETGSEVSTECVGLRRLGAAPLDMGDGRYQAHFVSVNTPTATLVLDPAVVTSDLFNVIVPIFQRPFGGAGLLSIAGYASTEDPILFPFGTTPTAILGAGFPAPKPYARHSVNLGLNWTVEVRRDLASQVKACATFYSAEGLSAEAIAARDDEAVAACANPNIPLDGRAGWQKREGAPNAERTQFTTDATDFLAPDRRIIIAFEVSGRVRSYVFFLVAGGRIER